MANAACSQGIQQPQTFVPVCASVICEAPGVIYVSIDPDVWKIRCRQCQEKTEHKCPLKKLKNKFKGDPSKRRQPKTAGDEDGNEDEDEEQKRKNKLAGKKLGVSESDELNLEPDPQIPDDYCACPDRPKDVPAKPCVCLCEIYKPLNFMLELEVTGEFKPAYVPKTKKGKE